LPNVGPYIYDVSISGFTRSSIYIYDISSLRVKLLTPLLLMMVHFRWPAHNLSSSDGRRVSFFMNSLFTMKLH